ncbi:MAG: TonB-dependent receptor [Blastocatellia bacterium]|nr:TonB-dependent receptor [Blastocatellia bacterium]
MLRRFFAHTMASFVVVLLLQHISFAQTVTGTLSGTITDQTGAIIPNAQVTAKNLETSVSRTVTTNGEGFYNMPFLPLGTYDVTVDVKGFQKTVKQGVAVELNKNTVSNFKLDVAGASTEVTITGETPQIETTTGEIKHSLDAGRIEDTPLAGRNFISLIEQIPGFTTSSFGGDASSGQNNPTNSSGSFATFNGLGTRSATFQIDGINNDDSSENQNRQGVNISTIRELQVLTNAFSAEFGRGGAAVQVQTKSGTNQFHGDLFDYIQNDAFNANGYLRNAAGNSSTTGQQLQPRSKVRRHQYGGTFGGPFWFPPSVFGPASFDGRERLFFFIGAERIYNNASGTYTRTIFLPGEEPKACSLGPDGKPILPKPGDPLRNFCVDPTTHPNLQRDLAFMRSVINLYRTPELQGVAPNDPLACADLISSGRENRCVTLGITSLQPRSDYSGKLDFKATQNDTLVLRYQYSRQHDTTGRFILGDTFGARNDRQYNLGSTFTHLFSNRQVGEFRYGFGNRATLQDVSDGNDIPTIRFSTNLCTGTGVGACGGIIGTSTNVPINRRQRDHQFVYNHTLTLGRQTLKAGIDHRMQALDDITGDRARGFWTFGTNDSLASIRARTGYTSMENFMRGFVTAYQKGYGDPYAENRFGETNLYVQNDWRVLRNLTLNLGARYEYVRATKEAEDRFIYGIQNDKNNIEPRFGFAFSPSSGGALHWLTGDPGKFVIRGGYGINHGRIFQSIYSQNQLSLRTQPPNGFGNSFGGLCPNEISDPSCGFVFTPGVASRTTAFTANSASNTGAVRDIGGRLNTTLLVPAANLGVPYTQTWNLTMERQLKSFALQVGYNGNRSIGNLFFDSANDAIFPFASPSLFVDVGGGNFKPVIFDRACTDTSDPICVIRNADNSINVASSGAARTFSALTSTTATLAQKGIVIVNGEPHGYISLATPRVNERRPNAAFSRNVNLQNFGWGYYHGLTTKLSKRLSNGLSFTVSYVFSKAIDTGSEATFTVVDTNAPAGKKGGAAASLRGLSAFHAAHRFVASYSYELPILRGQRGFIGSAFGGWKLTGTTVLQSGNPFSVTAGYDINGDGLAGDRPQIIDPSILGRSIDNPRPGSNGSQISVSQLPASAFLPAQGAGNSTRIYLPGSGNEGTVGRNVFFMQGINSTDMTASKQFRISEGVKLVFRMEFYNLFNRTTFGAPVRSLASGTPLGTITTERNPSSFVNSGRFDAISGRQGQLALQLKF